MSKQAEIENDGLGSFWMYILTHKCVMGFSRCCATHWITLLVHCGGAAPTMTSVSTSMISCFTPSVALSRASQCTVGRSGTGC